jgi:hypothetical protein
MFETLIQEITIGSDDLVKPIFKLPLAGDDEGLALDGPALTSDNAVRALPHVVGDTGIEPVTSSVSKLPEQRRWACPKPVLGVQQDPGGGGG